MTDKLDKIAEALTDIADSVSGGADDTNALLRELISQTKETRFLIADTINGDPPGHAHNLWWIEAVGPLLWAEAEDARREAKRIAEARGETLAFLHALQAQLDAADWDAMDEDALDFCDDIANAVRALEADAPAPSANDFVDGLLVGLRGEVAQ